MRFSVRASILTGAGVLNQAPRELAIDVFGPIQARPCRVCRGAQSAKGTGGRRNEMSVASYGKLSWISNMKCDRVPLRMDERDHHG
jgi:hypothetical protein